jgi:hypothetical protein
MIMNLANNLFASSWDNLHPIISFGLGLAIKLVTFRLRPTRQGQHPLAKAAIGLNEQISGVIKQISGRGQSD